MQANFCESTKESTIFGFCARFILIACYGLVAACSNSPSVGEKIDERQRLSFAGLYYPFLPLEIVVRHDNSLTWRDPPDNGGVGRVCGPESEYVCTVLDGLWKFAVPTAVVANARIGESWTFEQVAFENHAIIQYPMTSRQSEILVVRSGDSSAGWTLFHYDVKTGLEAITYVHRSWEPNNRDQSFIPVIEVTLLEEEVGR